jgi:hypothetical protein
VRESVRVLFAVALEQKVVQVVEVVLGPHICEVGGCAYAIDLQEVLVVFFIGFVGFSEKAKPDAPLVQEEVLLKHAPITKLI